MDWTKTLACIKTYPLYPGLLRPPGSLRSAAPAALLSAAVYAIAECR